MAICFRLFFIIDIKKQNLMIGDVMNQACNWRGEEASEAHSGGGGGAKYANVILEHPLGLPYLGEKGTLDSGEGIYDTLTQIEHLGAE